MRCSLRSVAHALHKHESKARQQSMRAKRGAGELMRAALLNRLSSALIPVDHHSVSRPSPKRSSSLVLFLRLLRFSERSVTTSLSIHCHSRGASVAAALSLSFSVDAYKWSLIPICRPPCMFCRSNVFAPAPAPVPMPRHLFSLRISSCHPCFHFYVCWPLISRLKQDSRHSLCFCFLTPAAAATAAAVVPLEVDVRVRDVYHLLDDALPHPSASASISLTRLR